jgi:hypothetical protein
MFRKFVLLWAVLSLSLGALADDAQAKAEKEVRKISAMAADGTARPLVSQVVAEYLKTTRMELVQQRKTANLSYGDLFVVYQLSGNRERVDDLLPALKSGKDVWQIGKENHADWKAVAAEAKKLNDRLESSFYQYFQSPPRKTSDDEHTYKAANDNVPADSQGLTQKDLAAAEDTFARCFQRARGMPMKGEMPDQKDRQSSQMETDPR